LRRAPAEHEEVSLRLFLSLFTLSSGHGTEIRCPLRHRKM
jgi:hypothetical protein